MANSIVITEIKKEDIENPTRTTGVAIEVDNIGEIYVDLMEVNTRQAAINFIISEAVQFRADDYNQFQLDDLQGQDISGLGTPP